MKFNWVEAAFAHGAEFYIGGSLGDNKRHTWIVVHGGPDRFKPETSYPDTNEGQQQAAKAYCQHYGLELEAACAGVDNGEI